MRPGGRGERQAHVRTAVATSILVGAILGSPTPPAIGDPSPPPPVAETSPSVTVSPLAPLPGQTTTVTVTGCDDEPDAWGIAAHDDLPTPFPFVPGPSGTWISIGPAPRTDIEAHVTCSGWEGAFTLDVEAPYIEFGPYRAPVGPPDPPETLEGTDCPSGTKAWVELDGGGRRWTTAADIDERGDWSVDLASLTSPAPLASLPVGTIVMAWASCGSLLYEPVAWSFGESPTTTSTVPPSASPGPGREPPAALPLDAAPGYTG
jgi:hypothetical protein